MTFAYLRNCAPPILLLAYILAATVQGYGQSFSPAMNLRFVPDSLQATALDFGPDERLYVLDLKGDIYSFSIIRYIDVNDIVRYDVVNTEHIPLVRGIQNYDDDGTPNDAVRRQATGIEVVGTAENPVIYVTSSDYRVNQIENGEFDSNLNTNSGTISRLIRVSGQWQKVDIVRGLPRSEENHATNGLILDTLSNKLYVAQGGHTNGGGPWFLFGYLNEYALSSAILSVDLNAIDTMPVQIDTFSGDMYIYDLPTVDDPTRDNANGIEDPMTPGYDGIDINDPHGGNDGLNQAKLIEGEPVQVYSGGYRNPYDVIMMSDGFLYTWDNGGNQSWGGKPANEGLGTATNDFFFDISTVMLNRDKLHRIDSMGYYGGHPNPIRCNPLNAGLYTFGTSGIFRTEYDPLNPSTSLPFDWPPVDTSLANPQEGVLSQGGDMNDASIYYHVESTNGLTEYTATNFDSAMTGDLLAAGWGSRIYRVHFDSARNVDTVSILAQVPGALDITARGDDQAFPGTIWIAVLTTSGAGRISLLEPTDLQNCTGNDFLAIDEDLDGYTNSDEIDNGTDPCLGSFSPDDHDSTFINGFLVSNLNDPDDDDDGIPDTLDAFAWDAANGQSTFMPIDYNLFNTDPGSGFYGLGFSGLMTNGSSDYLELWKQEENSEVEIIAGGATGVISLIGVDSGDARGSLNTQSDAFQFGVAVDSLDEPFVVKINALGPVFPDTIEDFQSVGAFIGTGDQDNYIRIAAIANDSNPAIEVLRESEGLFTSEVFDAPGLTEAFDIGLIFTVNPANGMVFPYYSLDGADPIAMGGGFAVTGPLLETIKGPDALAVGIIATSRGSESRFDASWDRIQVKTDPVSFGIELPGDWVIQTNGFGCSPDGTPGNCCSKTHEYGFVQSGDKFYLIGGRELDHVEIYDPITDIWTIGADLPLEQLHHFQALDYNGLIVVAGAFNGDIPNEQNVDSVYVYDPVSDSWFSGPALPPGRERGSASAAIYDDKLYIIGGNNMGHNNGSRAWVDVYDFASNSWDTLPDAPHKRDHFHAVIIDHKLYAAAGRRTGFGPSPGVTEPIVDVLDLLTGTWDTLASPIPTERAGAASIGFSNEVLVIGGETSEAALNVVEALNVNSGQWRTLDGMNKNRHGIQAIRNGNSLFTVTGAAFPGGTPIIGDSEWYYPYGPTSPVVNPITQSALHAPDTVSFEKTAMYDTSMYAAVIRNDAGDQAILVTGVELLNGSVFTLADTIGFPRFVKPGDSISLPLLFHPELLLDYSDTIRVAHTGSNAPVTNIVLKGSAELTWIGGNRVYVDSSFTGLQFGTAWDSAVTSLKTALDVANSSTLIDEIWIAKGTYYPGTSRDNAFQVPDSVFIYGGFEGTETDLAARAPDTNKVVLSGDIGIQGDSTDNSYHVVIIGPDVDTSHIDGVIIEGALADGIDAEDRAGAGVFNEGVASIFNSTIRNCSSLLSGSAIFSRGISTRLHLQNVSFSGNSDPVIANEGNALLRISGAVSGGY